VPLQTIQKPSKMEEASYAFFVYQSALSEV
jgi:hypothetical protein